MQDPDGKYIKAWAREYEETPFFFEEKSDRGTRLIAWSEESEQTQRALYLTIESLPWDVDVLLKISVGREGDRKTLWSRYHGNVSRSRLIEAIQANEKYVFSDGMHQLCVKDPASDRYLAFDDHGVFFLYFPLPSDASIFRTLGFEERYAEPIYCIPHYQCAPAGSEQMEQKFAAALQLEPANSDLDK